MLNIKIALLVILTVLILGYTKISSHGVSIGGGNYAIEILWDTRTWYHKFVVILVYLGEPQCPDFIWRI